MSYLTAMRFVAAALLFAPAFAHGQTAAALASADEIVTRMTEASQIRTPRMAGLRAHRHYHVEYNGISHLAADLDAEVEYNGRGGKSLRVTSESGSHMLADKVIRRALASELEASENPSLTALTPANYRFRLVGSETRDGRPAYVLEVEPLSASRFLYRGRIWVDAADFAVVRIDATPARNPSFWIARATIEQSFEHNGELWLPHHNRAETRVRIGGTAVLTIDFDNYRLPGANTIAANTGTY